MEKHFNFKDRAGEKYLTNQGYEIEIIKYHGRGICSIKFNDNNETVAHNIWLSHIKTGKVANLTHPNNCGVGFLGYGKYNTKLHRAAWNRWHSMISRCYNDLTQSKRPTYSDCSVAEEWHNFQNFAEWFYKRYDENTMKRWQLDKDILIQGNRVYSSETCCLVPNEINGLFKPSLELPSSHFRLTATGKYNCRLGGKHVGNFLTVEECLEAYKNAKEKLVKEKANLYKDILEERVYQALMEHEHIINY